MASQESSWSPPLNIKTTTTSVFSVVHARPRHVHQIHEIQALAYKDHPEIHEDPAVFRSKIKAYPAGNFVVLATTSVTTTDDTGTWDHPEPEPQPDDDLGGQHQQQQQQQQDSDPVSTKPSGSGQVDDVEMSEPFTVVEESNAVIVEVDPTEEVIEDQGETLAPEVEELSSDTEQDGPLPDADSNFEQYRRPSTSQDASSTLDSSLNPSVEDGAQETGGDKELTVLVQWEKPVGYLVSNPYEKHTVTLHHIHTGGAKESTSQSETDMDTDTDTTDSDDMDFEHDQVMEKYFIHDLAIHPSFRSQGLAAKLIKALEDSLRPRVDHYTANNDEEAQESEEEFDSGSFLRGREDETQADGQEETTDDGKRKKEEKSHVHPSTGSKKKSKKQKARKHGAPNLKEIVLVSVQNSRPFWEKTGGYSLVMDHDHDLSVYGDGAFFMSKRL